MDDVSGITFWVDDSSVLELKKQVWQINDVIQNGKGIQTERHVFFKIQIQGI